MLWNLSLTEKYENFFEFSLESMNGKEHVIMSTNAEELRNDIKKVTMENIRFFDNIYSNPLELNLRNIFPISYLEIKDIYKKLGNYSDCFEICLDCLICKCCDQKFTDYRSCVHHINRKRKKSKNVS